MIQSVSASCGLWSSTEVAGHNWTNLNHPTKSAHIKHHTIASVAVDVFRDSYSKRILSKPDHGVKLKVTVRDNAPELKNLRRKGFMKAVHVEGYGSTVHLDYAKSKNKGIISWPDHTVSKTNNGSDNMESKKASLPSVSGQIAATTGYSSFDAAPQLMVNSAHLQQPGAPLMFDAASQLMDNGAHQQKAPLMFPRNMVPITNEPNVTAAAGNGPPRHVAGLPAMRIEPIPFPVSEKTAGDSSRQSQLTSFGNGSDDQSLLFHEHSSNDIREEEVEVRSSHPRNVWLNVNSQPLTIVGP